MKVAMILLALTLAGAFVAGFILEQKRKDEEPVIKKAPEPVPDPRIRMIEGYIGNYEKASEAIDDDFNEAQERILNELMREYFEAETASTSVESSFEDAEYAEFYEID